MYSISHPEFHCTEDFSLIMQTLQRLQHNTSLPHFKRMAPPWFHSFIHLPQIPGMPRTINTWWRVEDTVVNETFSASGVHHPLGFLIPQAFLSICHMPYHVLSVGTQQRSRQKIKSFLNSVILGIDMSYEESTAEEVIAGAIFSRLITEAMFEQGPPWLKQWINQFSCGKICWEVVAVVQSLSHVWLFVTPQSTAHQATLPSLSLGVCANSCPLSQWCHPTISSFVAPFPSCPQSFPESESLPMSWLFTSGGQNIGALASASVLPMNMQGWFPLRLTGLILLPKGFSRFFPSTSVQKHQFFSIQPSLWSSSSVHDYWKKPWLWQYGPLLAKWCWPERTQNIRPKQRRMMNYFFWSLTTFLRSYEQCPTLLCSNLNHIAIRSTKHSQHNNTRSVHWA